MDEYHDDYKGRNMHRKIATILAGALVAGLALTTSPASAGRSSIFINETAPHFGDKVTFSITETRQRPWVYVRCYQSGVLVYSHTNDYSPESITGQVFTMGPTTVWQDGAANCTAQLLDKTKGKFPGRALATTSFEVLDKTS